MRQAVRKFELRETFAIHEGVSFNADESVRKNDARKRQAIAEERFFENVNACGKRNFRKAFATVKR